MHDDKVEPTETAPEAAEPEVQPDEPEARSTETEAETEAEAASDIEILAAEAADLKDQLLRALAEGENTRKRAAREREDSARYGISNFARDVVAVADNLRRAIDSLPADNAGEDVVKTLTEGVAATLRQLDAAFENHGIERIDPAGQPFDHNLHQAMFEDPDSDQPPGTVVQVIQHGYKIHDRLLRPAMVGVAKKPREGARIDTEA
jgi:molecular chaperone GrpE